MRVSYVDDTDHRLKVGKAEVEPENVLVIARADGTLLAQAKVLPVVDEVK